MSFIQPFIAALEKGISGLPFLVRLYACSYISVVQKEIELAGITAGDRVVNIGCGAVPFTSLHVALLTQASVVAIDRDFHAVKRARRCLEKLGLSSRVTVQEGDAADMRLDEFDVAIVALQACTQERIMRNLMSAVRPNGRLVFRQPRKEFRHQYDALPDDIALDGEVKQGMQTFDRSVLLVKPLKAVAV